MSEIKLIEQFDRWDKWYEDHEVEVGKEYDWLGLHENQGVILDGAGGKDTGIVKGNKIVRIKGYYKPCGISPKNTEQTVALELLRDKSITMKILSGVAGSGKSLLACAHAFQRLQDGDISKIVIAKSMTPVGKEIGFLKGSMQDKVMPWLGPFYDNFVHCGLSPEHLSIMMDKGVIEITPITYIQGRSISNAIIIIDEAQNLDMNILKQVITRTAEGSEIILLGDQTQVFEYRNRDRSIDILMEKGKDSPLVGSIHMVKSLRSPLADWAIKTL